MYSLVCGTQPLTSVIFITQWQVYSKSEHVSKLKQLVVSSIHLHLERSLSCCSSVGNVTLVALVCVRGIHELMVFHKDNILIIQTTFFLGSHFNPAAMVTAGDS